LCLCVWLCLCVCVVVYVCVCTCICEYVCVCVCEPPKIIIIGFHQGNSYKAYTQKDVESSHVINDKIFDKSILLISQFSENTRAFERMVNDQVLEFDYLEGKLIDLQTKSEWSYDGVAISGPLEGIELTRMAIDPGFWFEWVAFHPDTDLFGDVRN